MNVIDTMGVFEDASHLRLEEPVCGVFSGPVRVLLVFNGEAKAVRGRPDFRAEIGSYRRDFPGEPARSSDEWLKELREGE